MIYSKCQEGWETLKDHPIHRAGDLKHRPISGGAPKNAFFISMETHLNKNRLDEKKSIIIVIPSIKAHK